MKQLEEQSIRVCLDSIKNALKNKGISYSEVALRLQVSEMTVKRTLNQTDISLKRLMQLSDIAEIKVEELLKNASHSPAKHTFFTDKQDYAFAQYPHLWSFFSELFINAKSVDEIADEYELDSLSVYLYLQALETIELINLDTDNKFQFLVKPPLGHKFDSLVIKQNATAIFSDAQEMLTKQQKDLFLLIKPLRLPISLFNKLVEELTSVIDRFSEISEMYPREEKGLLHNQLTIIGHKAKKNKLEIIKSIKHGELIV
jgi:transcriptional regulator with XRE-family HTH domain